MTKQVNPENDDGRDDVLIPNDVVDQSQEAMSLDELKEYDHFD